MHHFGLDYSMSHSHVNYSAVHEAGCSCLASVGRLCYAAWPDLPLGDYAQLSPFWHPS